VSHVSPPSFDSQAAVEAALAALEEQLGSMGAYFELVLIGGSALLSLGLIERATRDVDLVALRTGSSLTQANPLPAQLVNAALKVARDLDVPADWLNPGPSMLAEFGLPPGFLERAERRVIGSSLTVDLAGRLDQIHFKLDAMVDQGAGRHERDLLALSPSEHELVRAARWAVGHDPSDGFHAELLRVLTHLGVADVELRR
jgi:hypothetical protein